MRFPDPRATGRMLLLVCVCAHAATVALAAAPAAGDTLAPESVHAQLRALAPQRPGVIDLYAVLVGADGSEDVFRKEVAQVRQVLEERLDAAGRVVSLVNQRGVAKPEATLKSLAYVLSEVAARMDREEDVLLLHITTHGAPDHVLSFHHAGRDLPGLNAKILSQALAQTKIRHRVIVVSACYAGGFVAPLANFDTLMVTAASSTRRSYGCGNDSEITDFSRAFYLKALRQTHSLLGAARMAVKFIHEDERASGREHSYPQVQAGAGIEERLRLLERQIIASRQGQLREGMVRP